MRNRYAEAAYLEFVQELVEALLARHDEHARRLVAGGLATALPATVLEEVHSILRLPVASLRAPVRTLRHLQLTQELVADEARRSKGNARRLAVLLRRRRAGVSAWESDDAHGLDDEDDPQLSFDFSGRSRVG